MKGRPDQIDLWCGEWARERKKVFGIGLEKLQPFERLGKLSCTLGRLQEEKVGAGDTTKKVNENGHVDQNWPEVYTGTALDIHRAFCSMKYEWRRVMDAQYVWTKIPVKERLSILGMKNMEYWSSLSMLKVYLTGFLQLESDFAQTKKSGKIVPNMLLSPA